MSTPGQAEDSPQNDIEQLRARLAGLEGEVVQLKARPAPPPDAESMLENATDGFLVYDSDFHFTYLNGDGERLLGKPKTELLGKTQWDVFPETIGTEIEIQYRRAMKERIATIFDYFYPPLAAWFEIRVSPSTMGGLLVWLRDITARRQTEMQREGLLLEIQAERQILSEIIEKSPVAISVLRAPDFIYELVNPAFQALAPGKQILGGRFSDIWGDVSDPLVASLENVIATGRAFDAIDSPRTIQRDPGAPLETIFVTSSWIPLIGPSGSPDRILTLAVETTERRQAEEQLRTTNAALAEELEERTRTEREIRALSARLINAQEEERTRLARGLHDDISQQIAALSIAMSNLKADIPEQQAGARAQSDRLQQKLADLAEGVRRLSQELHPAVLEHAGLAAALRAYCSEFSSLTGIRVALEAEGSFDGLPSAASLCIYRIVQEALQNVAKHARVTEASVQLRRALGVVSLTIADRGAGMSPERMGTATGLGLVSIKERTRLVNGTVRIQSMPNRGTTITVRLPADNWTAASA
jgi:PAS domain S-box-containing protein